MKPTPLPLSVLARTTVGLPFFPICLKAARSLSILWPSTVIASQPKAANLRFRAARSCWCMVGSDWPSRLTSTTAQRFLSFPWAAAAAASQTWPSAHSPSPRRTNVRAGDLSRRWAQGHAHADGQALAERARGGLDPGHPRRGVPLERARDLPQVGQAFERDDPGLGVDGPEQGRRVALGQDELVACRIVRVSGVPTHFPEKEARGDVGRREAGRRVPRAGRRRHAQGVDAEPGRDLAELIGSGHGMSLLQRMGQAFGRKICS